MGRSFKGFIVLCPKPKARDKARAGSGPTVLGSPSSRLAEQLLKWKVKTIHCLLTGTGNHGWLAALGPLLRGTGSPGTACVLVLGLGTEPPPAREASVEA